jgi:uncharacterized NAD(P)/FAD-binding protein YdhS
METNRPENIAIIGGGFCGILTAIHLMQDQHLPVHIHLINSGYPIAKGVAYDPHTSSLLLNVPNGRMSAFDSIPDHYVQWLRSTVPFDQISTDDLSAGFSTRAKYGDYLKELWEEAISEIARNKRITVYNDYAEDITADNTGWQVHLRNHPVLKAGTVVLATGNGLPRFPDGIDKSFRESKRYFGDPWKRGCVQNPEKQHDILIVGNGLTMVDTVISLQENGFHQTIYTISPNGYQLKPWKESKEPYTDIDIPATLNGGTTLLELVKILNRHRKIANGLDQSIYPVIDAIRPYTSRLWRSFGTVEKRQFLKYLNSLWGSVRHRLPLRNLQQIEELRAGNRLVTCRGYIVSSSESQDCISVILNCSGTLKQLNVQRIINCTGPETHIKRQSNQLLTRLEERGVISAGPCNIGISAQPENGCIATSASHKLFVIGSNLKGILWESTAIPELRVQAKELAQHILLKISTERSLKQVLYKADFPEK